MKRDDRSIRKKRLNDAEAVVTVISPIAETSLRPGNRKSNSLNRPRRVGRALSLAEGVLLMSLYLLSHAWQVEDVADGIVVRVSRRDLDEETQARLADELFELTLESGRAKLYLDLGELHSLPGGVVDQIFALNRRMRERNGKLVLCGLKPGVREQLHH